MSIRDLSGKRPVRHVDTLSNTATLNIPVMPGVGWSNKQGFMVRADTKPIMILGCDIRVFGGANMVNGGMALVPLADFTAMTSSITRTQDPTGKNPFPAPDSVVKGGSLNTISSVIWLGNASEVVPEMANTGYQLMSDFRKQYGSYRMGGYLLQPNSVLAYIYWIDDTPTTYANGAGISMQGCIEYIEGDYDYTEFFRNGMQPLNY